MRVALAQINPIVGDYAGNQRAVLAAIAEARDAGAELVVFPELVLNGYPPRDMLERAGFVEEGLRVRDEIAKQTRGIHVVLGYADVNRSEYGRRYRNAAALLAEGRVASVHHKTLLPTYDIFDEGRYFEPAESVAPADVNGCKVGITICEDIWNGDPAARRGRYRRDPVAQLAGAGAQVIVNISSSPFEAGKTQRKYEMFQRRAIDLSLPVIDVNQVGGNDDLVFDGGSVAFNAQGHTIGQAPFFQEGMVLFDTGEQGRATWTMPGEIEMIHDALVLGVRDYVRKCAFRKVVLGVSGGIDSAVTAAVAVAALGADNVTGILMPSRYSSAGSVADAEALGEMLGMKCRTVSIESLHTAFENSMAPAFAATPPGVAEENMQARIRGSILMAYSNKFGGLLLTTGNKSELAVGYCTLYGDMNGGLAVLSDLPKTKVYALARHINRDGEVIPRNSIEKPPSAELRPDQTDQDSLPPYEELDAILELYVEQAKSVEEIITETGFDAPVVRRVARMVSINEYKRRQAAPGIKVTSKAFGTGRRIPIARHLDGE